MLILLESGDNQLSCVRLLNKSVLNLPQYVEVVSGLLKYSIKNYRVLSTGNTTRIVQLSSIGGVIWVFDIYKHFPYLYFIANKHPSNYYLIIGKPVQFI